MLKRIFSAFLCFTAVLFSVTASFSSNNYSVAEAAKIYEVPYYYNQLTDDAKEMYNKIRAAVLECKKTVEIKFDFSDETYLEQYESVVELLIFHDPMTFNLKDITVDSYKRNSVTLKLSYRYKKESYEKMTAAYEKETQKVLSKFTEDTSTYAKIKYIHDYIIKNTVYDLESATNNTVYGTLVKNKGKCDGYAKTFSYMCGQAGIRTVTVIGDDKEDDSDYMHMWNKVYYNKKWYNVDVTWDDPVGNMTENLQYDFFMVSDNALKNTHEENNFVFEVPKAEDDSRDYFRVYKKYAEDSNTAKNILKNGIASAAGKKQTQAVLKCSSKELYDEMKNYILDAEKACTLLTDAKKKNNSLVTDFYSYDFNDNQYIITICVFYKNTDLEDYFTSTDELDNDSLSLLAQYGID